MLAPGEKIGKYEILEHLGAGGMASVWLARHVELGSLHALKILTATTETVRRRLITEGQAMGRLQHPNVVRAYDALEYHGAPILVLEYVRGRTLAHHVKQRGRLSPEDTIVVATAVCRALVAAHEVGIVHRDLKPENVLLAEESGGITPKLSDFGLVKGIGSGGLTQTGVAMGTPGYMAPEQIRNAAGVDHRSDLFAFGAVIFFMLAGRGPYEGRSAIDVVMSTCRGDHPPISDLVAGVPGDLRLLVGQLLQVKPEARPPSAAAVLETLSRIDLMSGRVGMHPSTAFRMAELMPPAARRSADLPPTKPSLAAAAALALPVLMGLFTPWLVSPERVVAEPVMELTVEAGLPPKPQNHPPPTEPPAPTTAAAPGSADAPAVVSQPAPAAAPLAAAPARGIAGRERAVAPPTEPGPAVPAAILTPVRSEGASVVWLSRPGERVRLPASVASGSWDVIALFSDTEPVAAGTLNVGTEAVILRCTAFTMSCR